MALRAFHCALSTHITTLWQGLGHASSNFQIHITLEVWLTTWAGVSPSPNVDNGAAIHVDATAGLPASMCLRTHSFTVIIEVAIRGL